jgi:peptide/nickel transport system permease protein
VLRAFRSAPSAIAGLVSVLLIILVAVVSPVFLQDAATTLDMTSVALKPSPEHLLGTDQLGRDLFARLLIATRLSLGLATAAVAVSAVIGVPIGAVAAVAPPRLRPVALRTVDTLLAFPALIVAIYVGTIVGPGLLGPILGVGIAGSFRYMRITSTLVMSVGGRDYIAAARVLGVPPHRFLLRYLLPNIAETLIIATTVGISADIVAIAGLSFIGLGLSAPNFDWGRLLTEGVNQFYVSPAAALGPAAAIAISALAFGFCGEALARALNPLLWTRADHEKTSAPIAEPASTAPFSTVLEAASPDDAAVLEVADLVVTFPGTRVAVRVLNGVSFSMRPGEVLGIVGESGSGKTMTALAIAQLVPFPGQVTGTIKLHGRDVADIPRNNLAHFLSEELAVVFQDPMSSLNPALTIETQLTEAVEEHRKLDHRTATRRAVDRLRDVNIATPETQVRRHPHEFSGGMRQRAMIAMGLMNEPELLIADEPTTALDVTIQAQIMEVLARINAERGAAIILISHNLGLIKQSCNRAIVMYAGWIVEDLPTDRLAVDPLHPYTQALLAAVPDMRRPRGERLSFIPGQAPDLAAPPTGCPFHPRCPLARELCVSAMPPLITRPGGRRVACWVANADIA